MARADSGSVARLAPRAGRFAESGYVYLRGYDQRAAWIAAGMPLLGTLALVFSAVFLTR